MVRTLLAALSEFASTSVLPGFGVRQAGLPARMDSRKAADPRASRYTQGGIEPPLEEVLGDPAVQMLMRSDRLERNDLQTVLPAGHR